MSLSGLTRKVSTIWGFGIALRVEREERLVDHVAVLLRDVRRRPVRIDPLDLGVHHRADGLVALARTRAGSSARSAPTSARARAAQAVRNLLMVASSVVSGAVRASRAARGRRPKPRGGSGVTLDRGRRSRQGPAGPASSRPCTWSRRRSGARRLTARGRPAKNRRREVPDEALHRRIATESNTFAPMPTGLDDYTVFRGAPPEDRPTSFTQPFLVWRRLAAERGFTVVGSLGAPRRPPAPPSGASGRASATRSSPTSGARCRSTACS